MSNILRGLVVKRDRLELTFKITPASSGLTTDVFDMGDVKFKPIVPSQHYNSLSKVLLLYFNEQPDNGTHTLTIQNLRTAAGSIMPTETFNVTYDFEVAPDPGPSKPYEPISEPIRIEDRSIKRDLFSNPSISAANPLFYVVHTKPIAGSIFVDENYNDGTIEIEFSRRPRKEHINSQYITVQRKQLGSIGRWEKIEVDDSSIRLDEEEPRVYVDFPANEGTTFEDGYKYRVRLSKDIKTFF